MARRARPSFCTIPAGPATLGLEPNGAFGWDNEFEAHTVEVPAFSVAQYKVTNGEYLEFVKQGAAPPFFWADRGAGWQFRGMFSEYPLPLDAPVYVTHEQAAAYARLARHAAAERSRISSRGLRCAALQQPEFPLLGPDPRHRR